MFSSNILLLALIFFGLCFILWSCDHMTGRQHSTQAEAKIVLRSLYYQAHYIKFSYSIHLQAKPVGFCHLMWAISNTTTEILFDSSSWILYNSQISLCLYFSYCWKLSYFFSVISNFWGYSKIQGIFEWYLLFFSHWFSTVCYTNLAE